MEQIKIVRKRSRAVPIALTLIILALLVAAVLFLAGDSTVERLSRATDGSTIARLDPCKPGNLLSLATSIPFAS